MDLPNKVHLAFFTLVAIWTPKEDSTFDEVPTLAFHEMNGTTTSVDPRSRVENQWVETQCLRTGSVATS